MSSVGGVPKVGEMSVIVLSSLLVTPAAAGVQDNRKTLGFLDFRFRGSDD